MEITMNLFLELEEKEIDEFIVDFATSKDCQESCKNKNDLEEYIIYSLCELMETDIDYPSDVHVGSWHICDDATQKITNEVWSLWELWEKEKN